jgi:hypothetical protein
LGLTAPGDHLLLFPWEEHGAGSFSVSGEFTCAYENAMELVVLRSSHYDPGTHLRIESRFVPPVLRRVGSKFSFNFPADHVSSILLLDGALPEAPPAP